MSNSDDNKPTTNEGAGSSKTPVTTNWFEDIIFGIIAGVAFLFWEPTKALFLGTYTKDYGTYRDGRGLNIGIGIIISLLAGIGVGYHLGWQADASWYKWLGWGVGTAGATFVYGWTLVYRVFGQYAFRLSDKLWSHVNVEADEYRDKENPAWLSQLLVALSWVALALSSAYVAYDIACYVQAHQAGFGWLGGIIAVFAILLAIVVAGSIIGGLAKISGKLAFFVTVIAVGFIWWTGVPVVALAKGMYHNLTGGDWGAWGYVPGAILGIIGGGIAGSIVGTALRGYKLRLVAGAIGVGATYALAGWTNALVAQIPVGPFALLSAALPWVAYGLELLVFIGFAFPLAHIAITHIAPKLANLFDLFEDAYVEKRGGYREFPLQVVTIAAAALTAIHAPALITAYIGWTSLWALIGGTAAATFLTYLIGYAVLDFTGAWVLGAATSVYVGKYALVAYAAHGLWFGVYGSFIAAALAGVLTFFVGFPLVYIAVRWATKDWLAVWLGDRLVALYHGITHALGELLDNLFGAAEKAYNDETPFRATALHTLNLVVSAAVLAGTIYGGAYFGFATWLIAVVAFFATTAAYSLVGQLFLKVGFAPIALVQAAALGVLAGILVHGAQPADWQNWRYVGSVVGGLVGAAIAFGAVIPWVYLFFRTVGKVLATDKWLLPLLTGIYNPVWARVSSFWANFKAKYAFFKERLAGARARFNAKYAAFKQRYNERTKK